MAMFTPKNFYSCGCVLLVVVLLWCMLLQRATGPHTHKHE